MRSVWRGSRLTFLFITLFLCSCMIVTSIAGTLAPAESVAALPLNLITGAFNDLSRSTSDFTSDLANFRELQARNRDLERVLAQQQAELVELREIESDYNRLAALLDYDAPSRNQEVIAADVIANFDSGAVLRTIVINRGTRDGLTTGMVVVTEQGLVGRIIDVTATASRVLLVTDPSSRVSARLENSREDGSVRGLLTGGLRMELISPEAEVSEGELVITSGLGGNLPPDIPIGIVTSRRQFEFELNQEAEVRSLIDFERLELVLVVTSFEPVDPTVFEEEEDES